MEIVVLGRLVSLRSLAGLSAPLFGNAADSYGYRRIMRLSLLLSATGMFLLGSGAGIWFVVAGMIVSGAGLTGFLPTCQAYISARLPFAQRARGIGVLEYSWAMAGIVGLPLMGFFLVDSTGNSPSSSSARQCSPAGFCSDLCRKRREEPHEKKVAPTVAERSPLRE